MKRLTTCLFVIALALLGIFVLNRRPSTDLPTVAVVKNSPTATMASNAPIKNSVATATVAKNSAAAKKSLAAFENFSVWAKNFTNGSVTLIEGERLAWKRREAMVELIQNDPKQALELAVPFELRALLPKPITKFFEEQVDGRGDYEVLAATDFSTGTTTTFRKVQLGDRRFEAFVYGRRGGQVSQTSIPLHGIALDGKLAVSTEPLRVLSVAEATALDPKTVAANVICSVSGRSANWRGSPVFAESGGGVLHFCGVDHVDAANAQLALAESGGTSAGSNPTFRTATQDAWTHGRKSVLYIRVNFPDDLTEPLSETAAAAAMNGVNSFYTENSYDLTSLTATITPVITLPQTKAYYSGDPGLLLNDARAWAKKAGFVTANYDRDIVALTSVPGYNWGGLAFVGGKGVWLQSYGVGVTAHELGHNYGLWHANFWDTTTNFSVVGPGANLEYGNIYDTMGPAAAGNALFNAVHKNILDWLKADAVQTITTNGVYRIYPFDVPASARVAGRMYAAALRKDSLRDYWLEFRTKYTVNPWAENGLFLNWTPWDESNGGAQLIDTTPGSPDASDASSRSDAAVTIGRTYNDDVAGVHITPLLRGASGTDPWIEYQVNLGVFVDNHPPVLAVETDQPDLITNSLVHFHATATDADGDTLAYAWTFDDLKFSTNNQPWISKTFLSVGDHVVRCVVSDLKGGVASANVVVKNGPAGFRLSGRVTDANGLPLEGVLVGNGQISAANFFGGWTDSDGRYVIVNVGGGTNLDLNASKYGYNFASVNWSSPVLPTNSMTGLDFVASALPTVNVLASTNLIAENAGTNCTFTVTRTGDTNSDLRVNFTLAGSARPGADYVMDPDLSDTNILLVIPAGTNRVTITINLINDSAVEGPETIALTLLTDTNQVNQNYVLAPPAESIITIQDDDSTAQPAVSVTTTTATISEGGLDDGQIIFTRNGNPGGDLFVNYSVSGTATAGVDYAALPGVALIPAGQSSVTIPLKVIDDKDLEADETVIVTVSAAAAYTIGGSAAATVKILDDDFMTVSIAATSDAAEPAVAGQFTVKRDGDLTEALVVNYTVSGTATSGADYVPLSGTVTIPANAASATIAVSPTNDLVLEGDESVIVSLVNTVNYDVGVPGAATVWIRDDEKPTVTVSSSGSPLSEQGTTTALFTIVRNSSVGDLTVNLSLSGTATPGSDYVPLDNSVVIPDGATSATLEVIPFHDLISEPDETVIVTLPTNINYNVASSASATVTITDDGTSQIPGIGFCFATSAFLENESPGIAVTLSQTSAVPVQVGYRVLSATAATNRYSLPQGILTISNSLVGFVPLRIVNDTNVQLLQSIKVVLFNPTNATLDGIKIHTYTIIDDDVCSVSVTATTNAEETGLVAGSFRIARVGSTNVSQLVNFQVTGSASAPSDYVSLGSSAVIPAGATFVDLPVTPSDDNTMEFSQTIVLTLTSATNANIISPNVATVTLGDNDTNNLPVVTVTSTNRPFAYEGGGNGEFLFTRSGPVTNALTVNFTITGTASNGTDYSNLTNNVIFAIGESNAIVSVVPIDDALVEGDETVILSLTLGTNYRTAYPAFAKVTVQDNDQIVGVDASDFTATEPGLVNDPGEFTFTRFGTTNTPVTIFYTISGTASNGVDYVRLTSFVVIPAGSLKTVLPVIPLDDALVEPTETITLTLLASTNFTLGTPVSATVLLRDDEPMLTLTGIVTNILEGSGSNGVFRVTRTGDPKYDFTAYLAVSGSATFGVDYPPFATNIYFSCGVTSIDLFVTPTNEVAVEGDETVIASLLPNAAYTILSPSNATVNILDAGTNATPQVVITSPKNYLAFIGTNAGLVLEATITDDSTNYTLAWTNVSGPSGVVFGDATTNNTTVTFTNTGVYLLRLTADDGVLQGHADILVFVSDAVLSATNILHWTLDEGSGTNAGDTSGNLRTGSLLGSPDWITNGIISGALDFTHTNDSVRQTSGSNTLNGLSAFTVMLWVKPATNMNAGILTADDVSTNATFNFATRVFASCGNYTNVLEATVPTTLGSVRRTSASGALHPGEWQHIALTWTNGTAPKLYFNGQLDQPNAGFAGISGVVTNCPEFIIGRGAWDSPAAWRGGIDDVRVFDQALSAAEILAIADSPVTNHAPVVDAGPDVSVQIGTSVTLIGKVTDDGLPNPPASFTNWWAYLGTNSNIVVTDPANLTNNTFVFDAPGTYTFRLTAFDGDLTTFDDIVITVLDPITISATATISDANELGPVAGEFTLTRTGDTNEIAVLVTYAGTASNGVDYLPLTNIVTLPFGSNTVTVALTPLLDDRIEGDENVVLTVLTNAAYSVGGSPATVTIHDSPYGLWSIQKFTLEELTFPNISGAAADFEHDGVKNFAEYAFNHDPKADDGNPPYQWGFETSTNDNKQHLTFTWTRRLPPRDVEYGVFVSTNLIDWSTNAVQEFFRTNDANGITETVKTRALAPFPGTNRLFMNIRVWLQQVPAP
jgi:hypothetical protein